MPGLWGYGELRLSRLQSPGVSWGRSGEGTGTCPHLRTCLAVVPEEALWADAQVGPASVLTPASVLAGAGVTGIHLWRIPRESARAARGCLGEGGEDSGKKGRGTEERCQVGGLGKPPSALGSLPPGGLSMGPSPFPLLSQRSRVWAC